MLRKDAGKSSRLLALNDVDGRDKPCHDGVDRFDYIAGSPSLVGSVCSSRARAYRAGLAANIFDLGASEDARVEWNAFGGRDNPCVSTNARRTCLAAASAAYFRAANRFVALESSEAGLSLKPPGIVRARWTLATDGHASP
jgi:hypothetical protein